MPDIETGGKLKHGIACVWAMIALLFGGMLLCAALLPQLDLAISGAFHEAERGFYLSSHPALVCLQALAYYGARLLGLALLILAAVASARHQKILQVDGKGWLFLLLALLIGPVLIANVAFKDHWGRARPREISEFGGAQTYSPPLSPQPLLHKNGSFISGDAAFGFYLPTFAYVAPREKKKFSRRVFWLGMLAGFLFGAARIAMGAHFFSDVVFAAFFMLLVSALLHAAMFGRRETVMHWRNWFFDGKILPRGMG